MYKAYIMIEEVVVVVEEEEGMPMPDISSIYSTRIH